MLSNSRCAAAAELALINNLEKKPWHLRALNYASFLFNSCYYSPLPTQRALINNLKPHRFVSKPKSVTPFKSAQFAFSA